MAKPKKPYQVGYGKPPAERQFKKGQSGNPSGRPQGSRNLKTQLSQELNRMVTVTEGGKTKLLPMSELIIRGQTTKAAKGDTPAFRQVFAAIATLGLAADNDPQEHGQLTAEERLAVEHFVARNQARKLSDDD